MQRAEISTQITMKVTKIPLMRNRPYVLVDQAVATLALESKTGKLLAQRRTGVLGATRELTYSMIAYGPTSTPGAVFIEGQVVIAQRAWMFATRAPLHHWE